MSFRPRTEAPRRATIWSTASVRLALVFSLIFGLGGAAVVMGLEFGLMRIAEAEARAGLIHQMEVMRADTERHGGVELVAELNAQPRNRDARRYLLLVVAPDGSRFSNGLTRQAVNDSGFRRNLPTKMRTTRWPDQRPNMLVYSQRADDGTLLAVGRDTQHLEEWRNGVRTFALWSGLSLIALALLAGLALGWMFLRRLEAVNRGVARVIAGRESERLPPIGFGREFDELAHNLNRMLDRQEAAISALKTVSEGMAHDLRTPLGRLRNQLEAAAAEDDPENDSGTRRAAIDLALEEADQVGGLIESLLALSRLEGATARLDLKPLDAGALVRTVGEIYRPVIEEAGGRLDIRALEAGPSHGPWVRGDASLLQQALANLVENAMVHAGETATVTLSAEARDGRVVLSVADDGPGVPADQRQAVLRRFHRLDQSRSRPGSGLGLAMVAAVARAHGGEVALDDNRPGLIAELRLDAWVEPSLANGSQP